MGVRAPRPALRPMPVGVAFVAGMLALALAAFACSAKPAPPPSSAPSTASPGPSLTRGPARCLAEAAFVDDVAGRLVRVVVSRPDGLVGSPEAISVAQAQLARLRARVLHAPFVDDRGQLRDAANDIIEGNQGLFGDGKHRVRAVFRQQVTRGGDVASTVLANVPSKRASCAP